MQALSDNIEARRRFLNHLHIGSQSCTGEYALEQIMTENAVFTDAAGHGGFKGTYIVDTLAGVRAFAEQVLVDIRDRGCIWIHSTRSGDTR